MNSKKQCKIIIGPYEYEWTPVTLLSDMPIDEQFTISFEDGQSISMVKQEDESWKLISARDGYGSDNFEEFSIYDLQIIE